MYGVNDGGPCRDDVLLLPTPSPFPFPFPFPFLALFLPEIHLTILPPLPSIHLPLPLHVRAAWGAVLLADAGALLPCSTFFVGQDPSCPSIPLGQSARLDTLLGAEAVAFAANGNVVRLAGLYISSSMPPSPLCKLQNASLPAILLLLMCLACTGGGIG